jgi:hypothetical protein
MKDTIHESMKAIVAALIAGTSALVTATLDNNVSLTEWAVILNAVVVAFGVVYGVPNKTPTTK